MITVLYQLEWLEYFNNLNDYSTVPIGMIIVL